ncbi:MAG TPA: alpha-amylase family glycosyl hydrolase, partial [Gemmatimonadales bacterium]|nr:alpha-amylase family glycosyl hydrolase [Gemmatimonadales bacterium]
MRRLWLAGLVLLSGTAAARQPADPLAWTRGATCYEIFIRSFSDSDGDGIGDLTGLTKKLDYVKGLGATCIWLMPVTESPSYHGYDVSDYYTVEKDYGTNAEFKAMVAEAHRQGIK